MTADGTDGDVEMGVVRVADAAIDAEHTLLVNEGGFGEIVELKTEDGCWYTYTCHDGSEYYVSICYYPNDSVSTAGKVAFARIFTNLELDVAGQPDISMMNLTRVLRVHPAWSWNGGKKLVVLTYHGSLVTSSFTCDAPSFWKDWMQPTVASCFPKWLSKPRGSEWTTFAAPNGDEGTEILRKHNLLELTLSRINGDCRATTEKLVELGYRFRHGSWKMLDKSTTAYDGDNNEIICIVEEKKEEESQWNVTHHANACSSNRLRPLFLSQDLARHTKHDIFDRYIEVVMTGLSCFASVWLILYFLAISGEIDDGL